MATKRPPFLTKPHSAYYHREVPEEDAFLMHVGPGTPAGEYLRRFWQPVAFSENLKDLPVRIKVMGEDLVVFRDKSGQVGLLELHCNHRGTSLEYGKIEEHGIRCCYHGWLFDVDGRVLETPLEPANSTLKDRLCHGAYPVREAWGAVFAYMGPPEKMPDMPNFDLFELPGYTVQCGELGYVPNYKPCNWLHLVDNFADPLHEEILHASNSGIQFRTPDLQPLNELAIIGEAEFVESPTGIITLDMRRVRDFVWVRNIEYIYPNIAILGQMPEWLPEFGPDEPEIHGIPGLVDWSVPIDDHQTMEFGLVLVPEGQQNLRVSKPTFANRGPRPYEEMQRWPGDYEAQVGQRSVARHGLEHLGVEDRGVTMMRKGIRRAIKAVQEGEDPPGLLQVRGGTIPTYGGDSCLNIPPAATEEEDKKMMRQLGRDVANRHIKTPPHQPKSAR